MAPVIFPIGFEDSKAYAQINALASHANKSFANIKGNPFASLNAGARDFNKTLASTNDRFVAFGATAGVLYGVSAAFKGLYSNAIAVEKALAEIQVNVKTTTAELKALSSGLFDVASATGQSFFTAASAAAEFGRQGLKMNQILKATQAALTLTQTTGLDSVNSVSALTSVVNTFNKEGINYADVVNRMAAADTSFAVSSKDLAEGVKRVGSTAIDANVNFNELLATITALRQRTSRDGSVIGNSLKTIFTRLQREDTSKELDNLGIKTRGSDGNFRNQLAVLKDISEAYEKLSATQRAQVSEMVGGVYQINIVKALFQDLAKETSVYSQALEVVSKAQNDAFVKSEFLSGTTASKINALKNEFVELGGEIGKLGLNDATKGIASELTSLISFVNDSLSKDSSIASTGEKLGQSLVKGLLASVTGPGLAIFLRGMAQFSGAVLRNFSGDIKQQVLTPGAGNTQKSVSRVLNEGNLKAASLEAEKNIYKSIVNGNMALQERNRILTQIIANQGRMGLGGSVLPNIIYGKGKGRTFASGYDPLSSEMSQISKGVGGASKSARPVPVTINSDRGREKVVANTDEVLIKNYMGTGKDAIYNKDMVRKAGGMRVIGNFGDVSRVTSSGWGGKISGNYASGNLPYKQRNVRDLVTLLKSSNAIQRRGAENELRKRGYFDKASSINLGIPVSLLSEKALVNGPRTGIVGDKIMQELQKRGTLNDPTLVKRGFPLSVLNPSAVNKIAKDTGFQNYPAAVVKGAQNLRSQRVSQAQTTRGAQTQQRKAKASRIRKTLAGRAQGYTLAAESRVLGNAANLEIDSKRKEQENIAARSAFYNYIGENPKASDKDIMRVAKQIESETGVKIKKEDIGYAKKQIRSDRNQAFAQRSIPFALGGAALGSVAGSVIGGNAGKAVGSLANNVTTLGSLGSSFGAPGAAIGALAGVVLSMGDAIKTSTVPLEKFQKTIEELGATTEKQQSAISKFFTSRDSVKSLVADPESDIQQLRNTIREQANALAELPAEMRKKILTAPEDEQVGLAQALLQKEVRKTNATTALGSIAATAEKENSGIGLLFRKGLFSNSNESQLKFGDLNAPETTERIDAAVSSLINNIDLAQLTKVAGDKANPQSDRAQRVVGALNSGNFRDVINNLEGLGVIAEDVRSSFAKNLLPSITGAELTAFNRSTAKAKIAIDELNASTARATRVKELEKSATIDFQRYLNSFSQRNSVSNSLSGISEKVRNARLGLISQDPGVSGSFKNVVSSAVEFSSLNGQQDRLKRDTSVEIAEFVKGLTDELSKSKIDETLGTNFVPEIVSGSQDESQVEALLEKLNGGVKQLANVSAETISKLGQLNNSYKVQSAEIEASKLVALDSLKVQQQILKKQKFDELISSFRNASPSQRASEELVFQGLKRKFFNPTEKENDKRQEALDAAAKSNNGNAFRKIISRDAELARELLDSNEQKKARGEAGLGQSQIARLNQAIIKDQVVNSFGIQSDGIQSASRSRNAITSPETIRKLEQAEAFLAKNSGSVKAIGQVMDFLKKSAGDIRDPENSDRQAMLGLAESLGDQLKSLISGTDLFNDADARISTVLGKSDQEVSPEQKSILKDIQAKLAEGDLVGAKSIAKNSGISASFTDFLDGITPEKIQEALDKRVSKPNEAVDTSALLSETIKGGLIPSQKSLIDATGSLTARISELTRVMASEANISQASAGGAALGQKLTAKEIELNRLTEERKGVTRLDEKDRKSFTENVDPFVNVGLAAIEKAQQQENKYKGTFSEETLGVARQLLNNVKNGVLSSPEDDAKGFQTLEFIKGKTGIGVSPQDSERQEFIQSFRKSLKNDETTKANQLDEQIKALNETLNALTEQIKASADETTRLRKEADAVDSTGKQSAAIPSNLGITVTGVDGPALSSLKDDLVALFTDKFKELLTIARDNPKLFNAMMG